VLEKEVMPWLHANTALFVDEIDAHTDYPRILVGNYMTESENTHACAVKAYADRIKARRETEL